MAIRNVVQRGYGAGASIAFVVTRGYSIGAGVASATVGGATALTEPLLVAGGQVNTITLTNDTWQVSGTAFNQVRQIILNGMTSAQSEITGWNKEVRDKESIVSVVRTSNTVVTITWTAAPNYDITVDETITVTVPKEALVTSITDLVATPTIGVTATAPVLSTHTIQFRSVSNTALFDSVSFGARFESASNATSIIKNTPDPLGFILTEDGDNIVQENGTLNIAAE